MTKSSMGYSNNSSHYRETRNVMFGMDFVIITRYCDGGVINMH